MSTTRVKETKSASADDYVFTYNPSLRRWPQITEKVKVWRSNHSVEEGWSCQAYRMIKVGDRAYLYQQGERRGIFGRGTIVRKAQQKLGPGESGRVGIHFGEPPEDVLLDPGFNDFLASDEQLSAVPEWPRVILAAGMPLPPGVARTIDEIINASVSAREKETQEIANLAEQVKSRSAGQGFRVSPELRQAIDRHAMEVAKKYYRDRDYNIEVFGKPFDLECSKGDYTFYVEVKGTQTAGDEILLTPGEVSFARLHKPEMVLFILHDVKPSGSGEHPMVEGGKHSIYQPWDVDEGELTSLTYSFKIRAMEEPSNSKAGAAD